MTFSLPTRFYGTVTVGDNPAPDGAEIKAAIDRAEAGAGAVKLVDSAATYVLDVTPPAGAGEGASVSFAVGGRRARETGTYQAGAFVALNLTVGGAAGASADAGGQSASPPPQGSGGGASPGAGTGGSTPSTSPSGGSGASRGRAGNAAPPSTPPSSGAGSGSATPSGGGSSSGGSSGGPP